jgi:hypothetical protein
MKNLGRYGDQSVQVIQRNSEVEMIAGILDLGGSLARRPCYSCGVNFVIGFDIRPQSFRLPNKEQKSHISKRTILRQG